LHNERRLWLIAFRCGNIEFEAKNACVVMRVSSHDDINTFSQNANVPIINALSDESHPCQLLADMMTYKEHKGNIQGIF
jgi:ornithine carbamoyltransferase